MLQKIHTVLLGLAVLGLAVLIVQQCQVGREVKALTISQIPAPVEIRSLDEARKEALVIQLQGMEPDQLRQFIRLANAKVEGYGSPVSDAIKRRYDNFDAAVR